MLSSRCVNSVVLLTFCALLIARVHRRGRQTWSNKAYLVMQQASSSLPQHAHNRSATDPSTVVAVVADAAEGACCTACADSKDSEAGNLHPRL